MALLVLLRLRLVVLLRRVVSIANILALLQYEVWMNLLIVVDLVDPRNLIIKLTLNVRIILNHPIIKYLNWECVWTLNHTSSNFNSIKLLLLLETLSWLRLLLELLIH